MVRTEGRSTACVTCLQRKKGCDRQRPSCGQCRKACIPCAGYYRPFKFRSYQVPEDAEGRPGRRPSSSSSSDDNATSSLMLREQLARSAYESNFLGEFWRAYLPNGRPLGDTLAHNSVGGLIEAIQSLRHEEDLIRKAALAMCLSTVEWDVDRQWMHERGRRYYAEAMHDMAAALGKRRKDGGMVLLTAVRLFSLHEAIHGADPSNRPVQAHSWMTHIVGDMALILANPPSFYASGLAHRLFVEGRMLLIIAALCQRKRTFLRLEAWKTLPWSINEKTPRDRVLDILADVPTLFEAIDAARFLDSGDVETCRQRLVKTCLCLHTRLARWYSEVARTWNTDTASSLQDNDDDLAKMHVMSLYWIACVLAYTTLRDLLRPDEPQPAGMDPDAQLGNLIRAVWRFLQPSTGEFRAHLVTFPLNIVLLQLNNPLTKQDAIANERDMLARCLERRECWAAVSFIASMKTAAQIPTWRRR